MTRRDIETVLKLFFPPTYQPACHLKVSKRIYEFIENTKNSFKKSSDGGVSIIIDIIHDGFKEDDYDRLIVIANQIIDLYNFENSQVSDNFDDAIRRVVREEFKRVGFPFSSDSTEVLGHAAVNQREKQEYAEWLSKHLQAYHKLCGIAVRDYDVDKIDWSDESQRKLQLRYSHGNDNWYFNAEFETQEQGTIYFVIEERKLDIKYLNRIKKEMGELMPYLLWKPEKKV